MSARLSDLLADTGWRAANLFCKLLQRRPFEQPQNVLILKPCCLGDVLLATPALAALRQSFPQAHITWAIGAWSRPMVENNPHVNDLIDCGTVGTRQPTTADMRRLVRRIRQAGFDTCFVFDRSPLLTWLTWRAGIPQRVGLNSRGRGYAYTVQVPVNGIRHEAELYLDLVRAVGVRTDNPRLEFHPTEADRAHAAQLLSWISSSRPERSEGLDPRPLVVIHPGGGENPGMDMPSKRWPEQRFALLANRLVREHRARIVLVGGAGDVTISRAIAGMMAYPVTDLTGELSWGQLGALFAWADLYVGNDTGATHLAVAMGTRTLAIFGPSDPRRYGPYAPPEQAVALWRPIPGLREGVAGGAPAGFSWDQGVMVEEAAQAASYLLQSRSPAMAGR